MRCPNCGNDLPPDTPVCPYCAEQEIRQRKNKIERKKIYVALAVCLLVLTLILAGWLLFNRSTNFNRRIETAENSYVLAQLCDENAHEAASARYQLRLIDAIDNIEINYQENTVGYSQTILALQQLSNVPNPVIYDHAVEVWENIERLRLFQLFNSERNKQDCPAFVWDPDVAEAALAVAEEYAVAGMDYQMNMERLIHTILPEDVTTVFVSSLINAGNAQDAVTKYQMDTYAGTVDFCTTTDYTRFGIGAAYDKSKQLWSFILIAAP